MAPTLIFDLNGLDLQRVQHDAAAIERVNPHRGHMRQIDGVIWMNPEMTRGLGFKQVRPDEFWVAGHIPGRPILPGVLMLEAAAQLASFVSLERLGAGNFLGFLGADNVRFRGQVVPGERMLILCQELKQSRRRFNCACQGVVDGRLVFEAEITGMAI